MSTGASASDPVLSVVVPSYETAELLERCLRSLERAAERPGTPGFEVIVVDNGSRDGSVARARASRLAPRTIAFARNRGFAAAVNAGLGVRRGRHVLLLNSDVEIEPDLIERALALLEARPEVSVAGARLHHPDGRPQRSVHAIPGPMTELLPEPLLRLLRPAGFDRVGGFAAGESTAAREVEAVRGAVLLLRGDVIEAVGPFDEGYFFFLEETDYCARVRARGGRVVLCEALRARHGLGASSKRRAPLATRIEFHRSLHRFLTRRHGPVIARGLRLWRGARSVVAALLRSPLALASAPARARATERWGLVLWHLRGCPDEPSLAEALRARRA